MGERLWYVLSSYHCWSPLHVMLNSYMIAHYTQLNNSDVCSAVISIEYVVSYVSPWFCICIQECSFLLMHAYLSHFYSVGLSRYGITSLVISLFNEVASFIYLKVLWSQSCIGLTLGL